MKKTKGFTLIEVIVAIVIVAIVSLTIAVHFVAEYRFRTAMQDRIALAREARIAMNHMTRVLRFAQANFLFVVLEDGQLFIDAFIPGGHLPSFDSYITFIRYALNPDNNTLEYTVVGVFNEDEQFTTVGDTVEVARNITSLTPDWVNPEFDEWTWHYIAMAREFGIQLEASEGGNSIMLETKIRVLEEYEY